MVHKRYFNNSEKYINKKIDMYFDKYIYSEIKNGKNTSRYLDKYLYYLSKSCALDNQIEQENKKQLTQEEKRKEKEEERKRIERKKDEVKKRNEEKEKKRKELEEKRKEREEKRKRIDRKKDEIKKRNEEKEKKRKELEEKRKEREEKRKELEEKRKEREEKRKELEEKRKEREERRKERENIQRIEKIKSILKRKWVDIDEKIKEIKPLLNEEEIKKIEDLEYIINSDKMNLPDLEEKLISDEDEKNIKIFILDLCSYISYHHLKHNIDPYEYIKKLEYDLFEEYSDYIKTSTCEYFYNENNIKKCIKLPIKHIRNLDITKRYSKNTFVYDKTNIKAFMKKVYDNLSVDRNNYLNTFKWLFCS